MPFAPGDLADEAEKALCNLYLQNTGNTNAGQKYLLLSTDGSAYFKKVADDGTSAYITDSMVDSNFEVGVGFTYVAS